MWLGIPPATSKEENEKGALAARCGRRAGEIIRVGSEHAREPTRCRLESANIERAKFAHLF